MTTAELSTLAANQRQASLRMYPGSPSGNGGPTSRFQTLSGILSVLRQRWKLIAAILLTVLVLGVIVCTMIRAYTATTIIEVNKDDPSDNGPGQVNGATLSPDDIKDEIQTDVSILQTGDSLALAVIKNLNLMNEPAYKKAIVEQEKGRPLEEAPRTRDKVLKIFRGGLKVESPLDTRLINITYKNGNPVLAASISNNLATTFINDTLERRQGAILRSSSWLQQELGNLKKQVADSEQKLADYERNTGMAGIQLTGSANGAGGSSVSVSPENTVTQRLFGLNQELTAAESSRISAEAVYRLVQSQDPETVLGFGPLSSATTGGAGTGAISPEAVTLINSLRAQETDLSRQYSAAAVKYGENNPRLVQLQEQIDTVKRQIQTEVERIRQRAANDFLFARRNEDNIRQQFTKQQDASNTMADKSVKLQLLAQEAFSNRALYDGLFSKLQTATLSSGTRATRISIVDHALPAGLPSSPKWGLYLAAILAVGTLLGITAAFLLESLDDTIRTPQDLDEIQGLTMLGYIPRLALTRSLEGGNRVTQLISSPRSPFSEAFRSLRTAINLSVPPSRNRTLLVTSALGGDGKTTVTYNLGVAFAQQGARVLLIDADMRNPELHRFFNVPRSPGLSELCARGGPAEHAGIVQHAKIATLFMLPAGESPELPSELLESATFDSVLARMADAYDYVLIDSPPILAVTDASILAPKVSGIIAVLRSRSTTRPVVSGLVHALHRTNAATLSFVLNDVRRPTMDGFYDYSYSREKGDHVAANA